MKRLIGIVIVLAAVLAALTAAISTVVSERLTRTEIAGRMAAWTGGAVTLSGKPTLTFLPTPGFKVNDVTLRAPDAGRHPPLVTISSLEASLKILPLLMGRIEVDRLALGNPRIHFVDHEIGGSRSIGPARTEILFDALLSAVGDPRLRQIDVRGGTIVYENRRAGRVDAVTAADLQLVRLGPAQAATLSGTFVWRDRLVEIEAGFDEPGAVLSGRKSLVRLTLAAEPASLPRNDDFDSPWLAPYTGQQRPPDSAPQRIAERLGIAFARSQRLGPLTVAGTLQVDEHTVTLSQADFETHGNTATGSLSLSLDKGRPTFTGELDFDALDLGPYVDIYLPKNLAGLLALPLSAHWLAGADFNVSARADEIGLGGFRLDETSLGLAVRSGRMLLDVESATVAGGGVQGTVRIDPGEHGVAVRLSGRLEGVSIADGGGMDWAVRANPLIGAVSPPQGTGTASVDLQARGATIGALVESLSGWAAADIRDGSVDGADIAATLERLQEDDFVIAQGKPFIPVPGRSIFSRLTARLTVGGGIARLERVHIVGERFEVSLSGEGNLTRGDVEAEGVASLYALGPSDIPLPPVVELPFGVGGTVLEPMMAPGIPRIGQYLEEASIPRLPLGVAAGGERTHETALQGAN